MAVALPTAKTVSPMRREARKPLVAIVLRGTFVTGGKALKLLTPAGNALQLGSSTRTEYDAKLLIDHQKWWRSQQDSNLQPTE